MLWKIQFTRVHLFFILFAIVLFMESIGAAYIISTTQAIERQFQIPSKLSGFMISASDLTYIPTVIFVSYFGSKGNRAKWIGIGTLISGFSHLLISSSNFLFPIEQPNFNYTKLQNLLFPSEELLSPNVNFIQLLNYEPIKDRINGTLRENFLRKLSSNYYSSNVLNTPLKKYSQHNDEVLSNCDNYTLNEQLLFKIVQAMHTVIDRNTSNNVKEVKLLLQQYVHERADKTVHDLANIQCSTRASFEFCSKIINKIRQIIKTSECDKTSFHEGPLTLIFFGLVVFGIGRTMPWSLGVPMIDDNFSRQKIPTFFAGISFVRILGPVCGLLIGSLCSSFYYTFKAPSGLTPKDAGWIGAWWMGYLIVGLLMIGPSIALYFFPVSSKLIEKIKFSPVNAKDEDCFELSKKGVLSMFDRHQENTQGLSLHEKFKAFYKSYSKILQSKVFTGLLMGRMLDFFAFRGYMIFVPKYLEIQFDIPQYNVYILLASFGVFGFAMGAISGSIFVRYYRLNGRQIAILLFVLSLITNILFLSKAFVGCYSTSTAVGINGRLTNYNYTHTCNSNCACQSSPLYPVCDKSGFVYFSPCHAGCHDVKIVDLKIHQLEFSSCECAPDKVLSKENCKSNCTVKAWIFFILAMLGAFIAGNCLVPGMLLLIRSVPPAHRSIAFGLQGFLVSLFATLPSPLVWGAIVDTTCLVWNYTCHGTKGACIIYEADLLRQRLHFTYVTFRLLSTLIDLYVIKHANGINILNEPNAANKVMNNKSLSPLANNSVH
ncbi:unnamed protein product [Thelazia callipaeda]|uniref:Solute carrier organic anion transporter family member n=1 Tax=Thelazia callipaeda TaxID=103827 RepID=A0A0N5D1L0_THECL|nr:unnamed protein product [Thelazia callipaeda]